MRRVLVVPALVMGLALPAAAELFRCQDRDGTTIYTDQKSLCPGQDPHEPVGVVHEVEPPASPPAGRAPLRPSPDLEASQAAHWRQKKLDAEAAIAAIRQRRDFLQRYVSHCNRGGYVTTTDETGIKEVVNCSLLRREYEGLEKQEANARRYLDEGLAEDCRKAGCLPGWIR